MLKSEYAQSELGKGLKPEGQHYPNRVSHHPVKVKARVRKKKLSREQGVEREHCPKAKRSKDQNQRQIGKVPSLMRRGGQEHSCKSHRRRTGQEDKRTGQEDKARREGDNMQKWPNQERLCESQKKQKRGKKTKQQKKTSLERETPPHGRPLGGKSVSTYGVDMRRGV